MRVLILFLLSFTLSFSQQVVKEYKIDTVRVYTHKYVLSEEVAVGKTNQPKWTLSRRFPVTRVYVQTQPGNIKYEQWIDLSIPNSSSSNSKMTLRQEFAFGLAERIQLDIYQNSEHIRSDNKSEYKSKGWSVEIRYAIADWDVIWGNPTLYFEYYLQNGLADKIEPKLLLGGTLLSGWYWGANLIYERELASVLNRSEQYSCTGSISKTLLDDRFLIGASIRPINKTIGDGTKLTTINELLLGPNAQLKFDKGFLNIEPLFGVTSDSRKLRMFVVFGYNFN